jgi:hypothetical protein
MKYYIIYQYLQKIIDFDTTYPDAPPIPEYTGPPAVKQKLLHPVPFMNKDMER